LLSALILPLPIADAQPATPDTIQRLAPFLDDQTVAVVRLDVTALNLDAAADRITKAVGLDAKLIEQPRRAADEMLANFRRAGIREIYAVFSLADIPAPGPFAVVPVEGGANADAIRQALGTFGGNETTETIDGVVFAGSKTTRERLRGLKPAARPDLGPALAATAGAPVQVALIPGPDQRRVVAELVTKLPPELGGGPGTLLTRGVRWGAVGVEYNPRLAVRVTVQSEDAAAAHALSDVVSRGMTWLSKQGEFKQAVPKFDDLLPALAPKVVGDRVTLTFDEGAPGVAVAAADAVTKIRAAAARSQSSNNLKQIALAWHNYHEVYKTCPANSTSRDGKPLLSWRVHALPFIEHDNLYKQFKLDEPWDSEHNKRLIAQMPAVYRSPLQKVGDGKTTYLAVTGQAGPNGPHYGALGARFQDITDGTSNTIMLVETGDDAAVIWTKPDDLEIDPKQPLKGLLGHYLNKDGFPTEGFQAALADGSVRFIARTVDTAILNALFTRDGGEVINLGGF
jgi:hypothetical protein